MPKRAALGDLTNAIGKSFVNKRANIKNLKVDPEARVTKQNAGASTKVSIQSRPEEIKKSPEKKKPVPKKEPELPKAIVDIDDENKHNYLFVPEYANDIFEYLTEREKKFLLTPYLDKQPELTRRFRAILVDWLISLQENLEVTHETLYQAVKITDQYLEKKTVPKDKLQLVGATAMWIACKYEERYCAPISDFTYMTENAYTEDDMMKMEVDILRVTSFEISAPLSYVFLRRFAKAENIGMELLTLARYVLEMSLPDYDMVFELESIKAAASLFLALRMKDKDWTPQLEHYSGYRKEELLEMAKRLNAILHHPKDVENVVKKYSHRVFFRSAKVPLLPQDSPRLRC